MPEHSALFRIKKVTWLLSFLECSLLAEHALWAKDTENNHFFQKKSTQCVHRGGMFSKIGPLETSGEKKPAEQGVRFTVDKAAEGVGKETAVLQGKVIVEQQDSVLNTHNLLYQKNSLFAPSLFVLQQGSEKLRGEKLNYNLTDGRLKAENFQFYRRGDKFPVQAAGDRVERAQKGFYRLNNARLNTCEEGDDSWYVAAKEIDADYNKNIGIAKGARLVFKGIPLLYVPWFDFPLNSSRKSGFLNPILGVKTDSGVEIGLPYYFNVAPNYDATLTPHFYSQRGLAVDGEFRYLEKYFSGVVHTSILPYDKKVEPGIPHRRYAVSFEQQGALTDHLHWGIDFHQVSDRLYFKDFGTRTASVEGDNLNRQMWINYENNLVGGPFSAFLTVQSYQTLQNSAHTVREPYHLAPQLNVHWEKTVGKQGEFDVFGQISNFRHKTKIKGWRYLLYPKLQWNFSEEWGYVRPKIGLHATYYSLESKNQQRQKKLSRLLPIFSLDSGLIFERALVWKGENFVQSLEPRILYTYIPNQEQQDIPSFDSEELEPNFSNLFRENRYTGYDRVNGANDLSYSLVSRFYHQKDGEEWLRLGIGQRVQFKEHLPLVDEWDHKVKGHGGDTFIFAHGRITDKIRVNADGYTSSYGKSRNRYRIGFHYDDHHGKLVKLIYKYGGRRTRLAPEGNVPKQAEQFEQLDSSFEWPINERYSILGRYNYSLTDKKMLDGLMGLNYLSKCHCWSVSAVYETYMTDYNKRKSTVFFRLNLRGLGGLGLRPSGSSYYRSIPGYVPKRKVK